MKKQTKKFREEESCVCCDDLSCGSCDCEQLDKEIQKEKIRK